MTSRERVLAAIDHRQPDRVPVDLGGTIMSGIMALAMDRLYKHLGIERTVKVSELYQMLAEVEADIVERFGIDVLPVEPPSIFFDIKRENYKSFTLFDGTEVRVPGQFDVVTNAEGGWVVHDGGDPSRRASGIMPKDGFYFDKLPILSLKPDFSMPPLAEMERQFFEPIPDDVIAHIAERVETLRPTGKALFLGMWHEFGPPGNCTDPNWLCFLLTDPDYVTELFKLKAAANLTRMQQVYDAIGDGIDIFGLDGFDYGTQRCEIFSPEVFEAYFLPFYVSQIEWIKTHTNWRTWKHSCGSIPRLMPYFADCGLDCINPVQCSADGMSPDWLKQTFGEQVTFWGGGVDTQKTLPFGTPEEVYEEVSARLAVFAPGGGYVFNPIHNVQANVPPENVVAMFDAVMDHRY